MRSRWVRVVAFGLAFLLACLVPLEFWGQAPLAPGDAGKVGEPPRVEAFGQEILRVGSRGGDVYELQGRLRYLGYYHGAIDGIFGWRTYWAVRNFQYQFGIRVDGIVGPQTKYKLWLATKNWRPTSTASAPAPSAPKPTYVSYTSQPITSRDIDLMARTVYGEARGEPYVGQVAVAAVILNRLRHPAFPKTIPGIIFQPGAFTSVSDGQIWLTPDATARRAVYDALNGWDPSGGALYYFNPKTATSAWIWSRPQIKRIGNHIFTR
ncbi:MAG: Spore cortex-lytic enzyme, lytic transglycosylase SleB [Brockia lithotrophica]|uniref:Spore cortex-lytic enzyme n=1 Tax=Brockia lithotrophica TaxID=933949 RepID=A0A2T5G4K6_9BACL|nr:MAG: Spore cortex-lytic enzyme, lytic transglycosylase SleB [Brockia lithotrophica]